LHVRCGQRKKGAANLQTERKGGRGQQRGASRGKGNWIGATWEALPATGGAARGMKGDRASYSCGGSGGTMIVRGGFEADRSAAGEARPRPLSLALSSPPSYSLGVIQVPPNFPILCESLGLSACAGPAPPRWCVRRNPRLRAPVPYHTDRALICACGRPARASRCSSLASVFFPLFLPYQLQSPSASRRPDAWPQRNFMLMSRHPSHSFHHRKEALFLPPPLARGPAPPLARASTHMAAPSAPPPPPLRPGRVPPVSFERHHSRMLFPPALH